jgi:hypothetical protein
MDDVDILNLNVNLIQFFIEQNFWFSLVSFISTLLLAFCVVNFNLVHASKSFVRFVSPVRWLCLLRFGSQSPVRYLSQSALRNLAATSEISVFSARGSSSVGFVCCSSIRPAVLLCHQSAFAWAAGRVPRWCCSARLGPRRRIPSLFFSRCRGVARWRIWFSARVLVRWFPRPALGTRGFLASRGRFAVEIPISAAGPCRPCRFGFRASSSLPAAGRRSGLCFPIEISVLALWLRCPVLISMSLPLSYSVPVD